MSLNMDGDFQRVLNKVSNSGFQETQSHTYSPITEQDIQSLFLVQEVVPASRKLVEHPSLPVAQRQLKKLVSDNPELCVARDFAAQFGLPRLQSEPNFIQGGLFSVGRAYDRSKASKYRAPLLLAMPCGSTGHILRLIKPAIEKRGWGKQSGKQTTCFMLSSMENASLCLFIHITASQDNNADDC